MASLRSAEPDTAPGRYFAGGDVTPAGQQWRYEGVEPEVNVRLRLTTAAAKK